MGGETEEHVFQVREGRDADECAALDHGIQERGAAGARHAAREQPILAADRDHAQLVLGAGMPRPRLCRDDSISSPSWAAWADTAACDAA